MAKDKILGAVIMVVAIIIIIVYTIIGPINLYATTHSGSTATWLANSTYWLTHLPAMNWKWAVVGPMWLVVILICIIAGWIGYSMLTTPPPVPLEELEEELEAEENKSE